MTASGNGCASPSRRTVMVAGGIMGGLYGTGLWPWPSEAERV
ncbi:MAG: twin-arginine translocation signal domain-containing protein [Actinomycetia bacterium]|nr:twin-arginine translocation signal domain-containing protein [Actinomycetes bacterium]